MTIALRAIFFDSNRKDNNKMINTLIGQKIDQTQDFFENGKRVPVTQIALTDNVVLQTKTTDKDSYTAIQLGAGVKKKPIRAYLGHAKKAGLSVASLKIREVRLPQKDEAEMPHVGDLISAESVFKPGDIIEVTGKSKGKGFAGGVKRHGFKGGPKTHGQSDRHRAPGSIGQGTTPGRVYKGKRMAGRMGSDTVTVKNLRVVDVDTETKTLYVSGLVPGHKNSWVYITKTGEDKKFVQLLSAKEEEKVEEVVESLAEVVENTTEVVSKPSEEVKTSSEAVATAEEEVKTAEENVKTVDETVELAAESVETPTDSGEQNSEEVKIDESKKEENA
jgi:large subunit ribosomal protein L3